VGLPVALAGLVLAALAAFLLVDDRPDVVRAPRPPAIGSEVPSSELAGEWSGEGSLVRCAGFDQGCPATRSFDLTIECTRLPCAVTPIDDGYGSPPLPFEDGRYRAVGPVPPDAAPTCGGAPTSSALWQLELTVVAGRLEGSYAESTIQGFDCGATSVSWDVTLARG